MDKIISASIFRQLYYPKLSSNKRQNGCLLMIAGSDKYHGSLIYALKTASRVVGLIYVLSTKDNQNLVMKLKEKTAEFIPVSKIGEVEVDAILVGPGLGQSPKTYRLVKQVLDSGIKAVLDADALNILDSKLKEKLGPNHILTPHFGEFKRVFRLTPTTINLRAMAKRYHCYIALKGAEDLVADPDGNITTHKISNAGMAKGGSGDVLAGLMAALFCKNLAGLSAQAALLATDRAGYELFKIQKHFYNSEDLSEQLPKTLAKFFLNIP
jgi:NAD(P)H-hydrate epimerase